ncbi:MAG: Gfo/Idh/MocA family oxidoreductase [Candidatus Poribacteria bacterium]|nr:Gfo/Idh/MocA family oxidoreductase [Candidatus Poribacteria bacterium]
MNNVRIAVIGCGGMGSDLATNASQLELATVVAVSDLSEERAKALADKLSVEAVSDYTTLLTRDDIDAIVIASPPFMHPQMVKEAAAAGKHIFCEKPMAPYVAQCDEMIAAVEKAGVKFQIGHVCRFHAVHRKVRDLVADGKYGSPTTILVHRIGGGWGRGNHPQWRMERASSGGTLMEVNAHEIDFMRFVCGDVKAVSAVGGNFVEKGQDYPDVALVSLQFTSGAVGVLHSSNASAIGGYGGRVDCTEGSIFFPTFWGGGSGIQLKRFDGDAEKIESGDLKVETPVKAELRAFVDAILNDTDTPIGLKDGKAIVQVAEAAYNSIAQGGALITL